MIQHFYGIDEDWVIHTCPDCNGTGKLKPIELCGVLLTNKCKRCRGMKNLRMEIHPKKNNQSKETK